MMFSGHKKAARKSGLDNLANWVRLGGYAKNDLCCGIGRLHRAGLCWLNLCRLRRRGLSGVRNWRNKNCRRRNRLVDRRRSSEKISRYWASALTRGGTSRSEEHTSELQSLMRISYAVFCLKK